jgi:hypothetical protein
MKNLLALIGLVVVLVAGLGWYLGWYKLSTDAGHVKVDLDTQEISKDLKKGRDAVGNIIDNNVQKVQGQTTSRVIDVTLPPLAPPPPSSAPLQYNPDGSVKSPVTISIPPPPAFPKD